jgi:hypothetical protein
MGFPVNERLTEGLAFPAIDAYFGTLTTAQVSAAVDMQKLRKVAFKVQAYTLGTAATLTAKLTASATSGGTYDDLTGVSATLVKATDDNKAVVLEVSSEWLNDFGVTAGKAYRYVKLSVGADVSSACSYSSVAGCAREEPAGGNNAASVKAVVAKP